jgi:serine/threonine-protein kinase HipA
MKRCPITYEPSGKEDYSTAGLRKLAPSLRSLATLPFTAAELRTEATRLATKMSIQGIQPKVSAVLSPKNGCFEIVAAKGTYILKPQSPDYPELPENEDLTMRLAAAAKIETPLHGLIYAKDRSLVYFIRRFDRIGRGDKLAVEDFAQLSGASRDTKYDSTTENLVKVIDTFVTFPLIERAELFRRLLFCFVTGNEDMHLKNFSLITTPQGVIKLSPAYDLLNSTIVLPAAKEELALPLRGKRRNLTRKDFFEYLARERLGLEQKVINRIAADLQQAAEKWPALLEASFLSTEMKEKYRRLLDERSARLR